MSFVLEPYEDHLRQVRGGSGIRRWPQAIHLRSNSRPSGWSQVPHGRGQIGMTQPLLHGPQINTGLETA
jgi:hypothetical protein